MQGFMENTLVTNPLVYMIFPIGIMITIGLIFKDIYENNPPPKRKKPKAETGLS